MNEQLPYNMTECRLGVDFWQIWDNRGETFAIVKGKDRAMRLARIVLEE